MSGVYRFEDLRVWQAAKRKCDLVGALIIRPEFRRDQEMSEHMNDASLADSIARMLRSEVGCLGGVEQKLQRLAIATSQKERARNQGPRTKDQ